MSKLIAEAVTSGFPIPPKRTRKLLNKWTFEVSQEAQAQYGIDIEQEIINALAQEITAEIDQEILKELRNKKWNI